MHWNPFQWLLNWIFDIRRELEHVPAQEREALYWSIRERVRYVGALRDFLVFLISFGGGWLLMDALNRLFILPHSFVIAMGAVYFCAILATDGMLLRRRFRAAARAELNGRGIRVCMRCGYDLRASSGERCSECGAPMPESPARDGRL
jgi:hypothetical protein